MKIYSNDIFIQTRSVLNELRREGLDYEDSIMSLLVLLFVIDARKKKWEDSEYILHNDGYDFFSNLEFRANDPEDDSFYDTILLYLRKLEPYQEIVINAHLLNYYLDIANKDKIKLIDQLIDDLSNNSKGSFIQISDESINEVFARVINLEQYFRIFDPCIGSGKLIVDLYKNADLDPRNVNVVGVEKNPALALLAFINLTLNGFNNISVHNGDALNYILHHDKLGILKESYDLIISDLPLGITLKDKKELAPSIPQTFRFYYILIQQCRKALVSEGKIYFTANSGLVRKLKRLSGDDQEFSIIAELFDVSETANWSYTSSKPYVLALDKKIPQLDAEITLVKLNKEGEKDQINYIDRDEFDFFSNIEDFGFFFSDAFERLYHEGKENFSTLSNFFQNIKRFKLHRDFDKKNKDLNEVILDRSIVKNVSGFRIIEDERILESSKRTSKAKYIKYVVTPGDWILVYDQQEIKIIISKIICLVTFSCVVIRPKEVLTDNNRDWLIAQFRSDFLQAQLLATINDSRPGLFRSKLNLNKLFVDSHTSAQKEQFVSKWKEARISALEEEKKRVYSEYADVQEQNIEEQIDLIHDLHHSLKNELSIITGAVKSITGYIEKKSDSNESVSLDDPVREPRKGADPKLQKSVRDRVRALQSASEEMNVYLNHYKTILKFDPKRQNPEWVELKKYFESVLSEHSGFTYKVTEKYDQLNSKNHSSYFLNCDKSVLRLVLTNVISNAKKYGITDAKILYSLQIVIQEQPFNNVKWKELVPHIELPDRFLSIKISNDGNSLPDSIKSDDFFRKGFKHGANAGSGIGTYHIKKGTESMGGIVWLNKSEKNEPYNFQLDFLFPYPMYKTKSQLKEEGEI